MFCRWQGSVLLCQRASDGMSCIVVLPIEEADTLVYNIERMYSKMTAADMIVLRAEVEKLKIWIDEFCHGIFYISSLLSGSEV